MFGDVRWWSHGLWTGARSDVACVGLSMMLATPARCDEPLALAGTWTAHVAAAKTGRSADIGISLTFAGDE